jgi:hypothetical protein
MMNRPLHLFCLPLLVIAACASTDSGSAAVHYDEVTFRLEAAQETPESVEFELEGGVSIILCPPLPVEVDRVFATEDGFGFPALGFEIAEADTAQFEEATRRATGRRMAVLIGGDVITAPVINAPLPGSGIITGGSFGFTDADVQELLQRLSGAVSDAP